VAARRRVPLANTDRHGNGDTCSVGYANGNGDGDTCSVGYANGNSNANRIAYAAGYTDAKTDSNAGSSSDTQASPLTITLK